MRVIEQTDGTLLYTSATPTLGLAAGVAPKVMPDRIGQANVAFTLDIPTHAIPSLGEETADQIAGLVVGSAHSQHDGFVRKSNADSSEEAHADVVVTRRLERFAQNELVAGSSSATPTMKAAKAVRRS